MGNTSIRENRRLKVNKDTLIKLNDNVIIASDDEEGFVFDLNTRKFFWVNGVATLFLELLEENSEGISLSSAKEAVVSRYIIYKEEEVFSDIVLFFKQMEKFGLSSCSEISETNAIRYLENEPTKFYVKPIIKGETKNEHRQMAGGNASTAAYYGTH